MSKPDFLIPDLKTEIPLFPLPNLVMLPGVVQPLHLFEPRYRDMFHDAIASHRCIAMGLLRPGYELDYHSKLPEVHPVVCLGMITHEEVLPDDKVNLLLRGLIRARIKEETETGTSYRTVKLSRIQDQWMHDESQVPLLRSQLIDLFSVIHPVISQEQAFKDLCETETCLSQLCDLIAYSLGLSLEDSQEILETPQIAERCGLVISCMKRLIVKQAAVKDQPFPPLFSQN